MGNCVALARSPLLLTLNAESFVAHQMDQSSYIDEQNHCATGHRFLGD
jgi:hypothetical protein